MQTQQKFRMNARDMFCLREKNRINVIVHRNSTPQHQIVRGKTTYKPHQFHEEAFGEILREMRISGIDEALVFGENNCLSIEFVFRLKLLDKNGDNSRNDEDNLVRDGGIQASCERLQ